MTQPPSPQQWWQPPQQHQPGQHHFPQQNAAPAPGMHSPEAASGFGGSFQSNYGGFGAFGNEPPKKKSKKPFLVGALVTVVLAGGGAAVWLLGVFGPDVLAQKAMHTDIARVLRKNYGEHDVTNVQCPTDQNIAAGHTFECSVDVAGESRTVRIRVLNDKPEYEVGAPR